jgi:hypothetical protein
MLPEKDSPEFREFISEVIKKDGKRHRYYPQSVEHHEDMQIHVEGTDPAKILNTNRPNEPEEVKEYRKDSYRPRTKSKCDKVISVISRIFNPRLFSVEFKEAKAEELKSYLTKEYPFYRSLMNFIKQTFIRKAFGDPNGLLVVMPKDFEIEGDKRYEPIPYIYHAERLLQFHTDEWYIVDVTEYEKNKPKDPNKLLLIDKEAITTISLKGDKLIIEEVKHDFGKVPAFRMGGDVRENEPPYLYESFISGVLSHWDKAVQWSSDLDAMVILHMYLEKWEMETTCPLCSGRGKDRQHIADTDPNDLHNYTVTDCNRCGGAGVISASPFEVKTINMDSLPTENNNMPIPPMGYIDRPVEIVDKVESLRDKEMAAGLSAINMDIVDKVGENQSGIAKVIDRTDLDGFLMKIADHVFDYVIPKIIEFTIDWMYGINNADTAREKYMPVIQKPVRFDVLSVNYLLEELTGAKEAGVDPSVISGLQKDVTAKMFAGEEKDKLIAVIELDPFPGMSTDDILAAKASGVISREDYYKKVYMTQLVNEAIEADETFLEKSATEKNAIIDAMVKDKLVVIPVIEVGDANTEPDG